MDTTTKRIALVGRLTGSGAVIESETTVCTVSTLSSRSENFRAALRHMDDSDLLPWTDPYDGE